MQINRSNYEVFFLDYRENKLTPEQVADLLIFLEDNPDLKDEFESFEEIQLIPEKNIRFEKKKNLRKTELIPTDNIDISNYENYMVADLEGDLTEEEDLELKAFISLNPKAKLEYNIFRSAFLKPDKEIIFNKKEQLKKTGLLILYRTSIYYATAIAATIVIMLGIYFNFVNPPEEQKIAGKVMQPTIIQSKENKSGALIKEKKQSNNQQAKKIDQTLKGSEIHRKDREQNSRIETAFRMEALATNGIIGGSNISFKLPESRNKSDLIALSNQDFPQAVSKKQQSFMSKFIAGLAGKVINIEKPERKSFLEYTIEGYNLMADKNVTIEKEVDGSGKVIAYSVVGENLSFSRNKSTVKE